MRFSKSTTQNWTPLILQMQGQFVHLFSLCLNTICDE